MNEFEIAYERMKAEGQKCRYEANKQTTRAEIWEQSADYLLQAIEKDKKQKPNPQELKNGL